MKAYRYNALRREDRKFNTTGREKNPNRVKFYSKTLEYAKNYQKIYDDWGFDIYDCELEVVEIGDVKLFDMATNFAELNTYKSYIKNEIDKILFDDRRELAKSKTAKDRKMWEKFINDTIDHCEKDILFYLSHNEFQGLSDFERQNDLVKELKGLGFDGYHTKNEIAIF